MSERSWIERLRDNYVNSDTAFDRLLPKELRHLSAVHWTPFDVAVKVAVLLNLGPDERVLDVGSGIGKQCLIGALASRGMWFGIERAAPLVNYGQRLATELNVASRVVLMQGNAFDVDWSMFDALYLFNPFELPIVGRDESPTTPYHIAAVKAQRRLARMKIGARVVVLNGFGGVMPSSYRVVFRERLPRLSTELVMWLKVNDHDPHDVA